MLPRSMMVPARTCDCSHELQVNSTTSVACVAASSKVWLLQFSMIGKGASA